MHLLPLKGGLDFLLLGSFCKNIDRRQNLLPVCPIAIGRISDKKGDALADTKEADFPHACPAFQQAELSFPNRDEGGNAFFSAVDMGKCF